MADIIWEDPPPKKAGRGAEVYGSFVAGLKKHPGKWAVVRTGCPTYSRAGGSAQYLKRRWGCEATIRKQPDGTFTLYARWPET